MPSQEECQKFAVQNALADEKIRRLEQQHADFMEEFRDFKKEVAAGLKTEINKTVTIEMTKEVKFGFIALGLYLVFGEKSLPFIQKIFGL